MQVFQGTDYRVEALRQQVKGAEDQLRRLRHQLLHAERQAEIQREQLGQALDEDFPQEWMTETVAALQSSWTGNLEGFGGPAPAVQAPVKDEEMELNDEAAATPQVPRWPLSAQEFKRYGRQLIMPEIGLPGQLKLKEAKVLIVGAGGLGCPAAAYLAGVGVGTLGLVDGDTVEESNLHRQVAHSTARVGMKKVESAIEYLRAYVLTPPQLLAIYIHRTPSTDPTHSPASTP